LIVGNEIRKVLYLKWLCLLKQIIQVSIFSNFAFYTHTHAHTHVHTRTQTRVRAHAHMNTHTHTHTHTENCVYLHDQTWPFQILKFPYLFPTSYSWLKYIDIEMLRFAKLKYETLMNEKIVIACYSLLLHNISLTLWFVNVIIILFLRLFYIYVMTFKILFCLKVEYK
jgi:hypothetical protein